MDRQTAKPSNWVFQIPGKPRPSAVEAPLRQGAKVPDRLLDRAVSLPVKLPNKRTKTAARNTMS